MDAVTLWTSVAGEHLKRVSHLYIVRIICMLYIHTCVCVHDKKSGNKCNNITSITK